MSTPDQARNRQGHAVVIGGSIAGLLAARVLTDYFAKVTLIERDPRAAKAEFRRGTPQARHVHILMERGQAMIEGLFRGSSMCYAANHLY